MFRRLTLTLAALGALFAIAACSGQSLDEVTPVTGVTDVAVKDNRYDARVIEVPAGTTVTWTWDAGRDHNVVGDDFESELQTAGTFTHEFTQAGTYDYLCTLHGAMTGRVIVTP